MTKRWDTAEKLRALLCELVSYESRTLLEGERFFPFKLQNKLEEMDYFKDHPEYVSLHDTDLGRHVLTALYKHPNTSDTIVLISHFDTVHTEEYGVLEPFAFYPEELTKKLHDYKEELTDSARADLESGEYLFGRGTMDMKAGLALQMQLIEKAAYEQWPVNLLLLTVPDEEVNSAGMRTAVTELAHMRDELGLDYKLFLNSEPSFSQSPDDTKEYMYAGTIGKIMPAALFYGKETHAGEPLKGMTASYIATYLTQEMEWNPEFAEEAFGETTPLPVTLQQKDLKLQYSTQTPNRSSALYNVFVFKQTAEDIMNRFEKVAVRAMDRCNEQYRSVCEREGVDGVGEVRVLRYEELLNYAIGKLGQEEVARAKQFVIMNEEWDDREKSLRIADSLMTQCQELAPAAVLLYAPPYYPAVNSTDEPLVRELAELLQDTAAECGVELSLIHYFNGISDLSYVNYEGSENEEAVYGNNTPVYGDTYWIPFKDMKELKAPVFNIGPFGKDAHQRTERLHIRSAFQTTPVLLEAAVKHAANIE